MAAPQYESGGYGGDDGGYGGETDYAAYADAGPAYDDGGYGGDDGGYGGGISYVTNYDAGSSYRDEGGHGGGDVLMLDDIFNPVKKEDKYMRCADQRAGAYSLLTGVAANLSMTSGKEIIIDDLVKNIGRPDYPTMPNHRDAVPMPDKKL